MATAMEYDVLREIVSDIDGIFSRVLKYDNNFECINEEEREDSEIVDRICRDILNNVEYQYIDYENVKNELVRIRDKYKDRPDSKRTIELQKEADEEFERLQGATDDE
jgi:hypothetical protein